ncbi:hypothetical protein M408DRAFT_318074 [Serendipita vermifera MAFF 305830]|uniref:NAD-dependent epimerase/dehydratase domain-containing protein n=1 Tax=Serendipita vermifera MAFF 305830 TaxID=933852 RepID=A0A0C2XS76_SERVB|nr:hypothetical protein M408DRAFT_318074 [Serendipita vermifera MAFF 305830]
MTSVAPPANILLTGKSLAHYRIRTDAVMLVGGTGFVGSAVLSNLLNKGFTVRAVVRSLAKAAPLETVFKAYVDSGKLTFAVVPDMAVPGAFASALDGIDGIVHCASPILSSDPNADPQDLIAPAVNGTLGIVQDAAKVASVKRIVVTSSVVTFLEPKEGKYVYTEADWYDAAPKLVEQQGRSAPGRLKYIASKLLAERAAWDWVKENKPSFELVTVLPPWVWGKSVLGDPGHIRPEASNNRLLAALERARDGTLDLTEIANFTDALDIAEGHVKALTTPGISGERFIILGHSPTWQDILDHLASNPVPGLVAPIGEPGGGKSFSDVAQTKATMSGEKAVKELGMTYRSPKDTLHDTLAQALEFGWKL